MQKYFNQISKEELDRVFKSNGYNITNHDQIFNPEREELEERESLFVLADDTQPNTYNDMLKFVIAPWSLMIGDYADSSKKIFTVGDFFIDEICPMHFDDQDQERLHQLNESYRALMSKKFPEYQRDFLAYVETLKAESPNDDNCM